VAEEIDKKKGEADLKVLGIFKTDGEMSKEATNASVSRVKFEVNIAYDVFDKSSVDIYRPETNTFNKHI
jgi:hypothetical protein